MWSSTIVTTVTCRMLITRKSRPKPLNRRIAERSVVTRERSWPDCHLEWKLIGSSWSRSYRSWRIEVSMPRTAFDCTQRRHKTSTASRTPRPSASSPSGSTPPTRGR